MKKILKFLNTRNNLLVIAALSQFVIFFMFTKWLQSWAIVSAISFLIEFLLILFIVNRDASSAFNFAWLIVVALVPIFGALMYLLFANRTVPKPLSNNFLVSINDSLAFLKQDEKVDNLFKDDYQKLHAKYVLDNASFPYWNDTECKYYPLGEEFFDDMIEKINNAKHFVFCEFFIIYEGILFTRFKKALIDKAKEGVPVYFMYDDAGCINLPKSIKKELVDNGIKVTVFNPVSLALILASKSNNRDHRKICVVDNEYGYTGGYNLADEYINKKEVYGKWKDSGVRLRGKAVSSFTVMFIQFYNAHNKRPLDYKSYLLKNDVYKSDSIIQPFSDSPVDKNNVSKISHYNMISKAKRYVYIQTPYLVLDDVIKEAIINARLCGVEVIIAIPHIPDKKYVYMVTKNNCYHLLQYGVKVYEYVPGFLHSKAIIVDDEIAINGTINMDLRSYYLNYENGVLIYNDPEIVKMKEDFYDVLKVSKEVTLEEYNHMNIFKRLIHAIMTIFSPLF